MPTTAPLIVLCKSSS